MDQGKILISKFDDYYFAEYPGTTLRGIGETIQEAIEDLVEIMKWLKNEERE